MSKAMLERPVGVRAPTNYGVGEDNKGDERFFILRFKFQNGSVEYFRVRKDLFAKMLTRILYGEEELGGLK